MAQGVYDQTTDFGMEDVELVEEAESLSNPVQQHDLRLMEDKEEQLRFKEAMWAGESNVLVAVRVRPSLKHDKNSQEIVKVLENKMVVVLDRENERDTRGKIRHRTREKKYAFDYVFDPHDDQVTVYNHTTRFLVEGVLNGFNATVFAYGNTGAGKTYTMLGTPEQPGIMALTLGDLFRYIRMTEFDQSMGIAYRVSVCFLEVYNENIRDLLAPGGSDNLDLREDPIRGPTVAGITEVAATSPDEVMELLRRGNRNRTTEATAANEVSSRSHAVLQVLVEQRETTPGTVAAVKIGKLSLIDLAGSERAAVTKNRGQRLLEGANINKSLLALGNCINALGSRGAFVPYRDSKLTRLLKDSLGGNCRTVMIANVSSAGTSFEETINTLKYANRAKNIKTKVTRNVLNVNYHVSEYVNLISSLKSEVQNLKLELSKRHREKPMDTHDDSMTEGRQLVKKAREEIIANFKERMQLRRSIVELEDQNIRNGIDLSKKQLLIIAAEKGKSPSAGQQEGDVVPHASEYTESVRSDENEIAEKAKEGEGTTDDSESSLSEEDIVRVREEIDSLKRVIEKNNKTKRSIARRISENETQAEMLRKEYISRISSKEQQELMVMEYRVGMLELENMELEQSRVFQDSVKRGKELTIEKLKLQIEIQNQIIKQQKTVLVKHNLDSEVDYRAQDVLKDDALVQNFDTVRRNISTPSSDPYERERRERRRRSRRRIEREKEDAFPCPPPFDPLYANGGMGSANQHSPHGATVCGQSSEQLCKSADHVQDKEVVQGGGAADYDGHADEWEEVREGEPDDPLMLEDVCTPRSLSLYAQRSPKRVPQKVHRLPPQEHTSALKTYPASTAGHQGQDLCSYSDFKAKIAPLNPTDVVALEERNRAKSTGASSGSRVPVEIERGIPKLEMSSPTKRRAPQGASATQVVGGASPGLHTMQGHTSGEEVSLKARQSAANNVSQLRKPMVSPTRQVRQVKPKSCQVDVLHYDLPHSVDRTDLDALNQRSQLPRLRGKLTSNRVTDLDRDRMRQGPAEGLAYSSATYASSTSSHYQGSDPLQHRATAYPLALQPTHTTLHAQSPYGKGGSSTPLYGSIGVSYPPSKTADNRRKTAQSRSVTLRSNNHGYQQSPSKNRENVHLKSGYYRKQVVGIAQPRRYRIITTKSVQPQLRALKKRQRQRSLASSHDVNNTTEVGQQKLAGKLVNLAQISPEEAENGNRRSSRDTRASNETLGSAKLQMAGANQGGVGGQVQLEAHLKGV